MEIKNAPLKKYTSLRIGGNSDVFTPKNIPELQQFLQTNTRDILFLGLGSNTLARDEESRAIVIHTKYLNTLTIADNIITAECGVTLAKLSRFANAHNQASANFLSTIPGSVGGSLQMNAGYFGREMWDYVVRVRTIDTLGNLRIREKSDFIVHYRNIMAKYTNEYFISCECSFDNKPLVEEILQKRYDSQPIGTANCGSVFKNPPNNFAAKLIEDAGLKGYTIGGAAISTKHANFIINNSDAKSCDVTQLIEHIQRVVKEKFDVELEAEVVIL